MLLGYMQGLNAEETADDIFCQKLIYEYESSSDKGEFISLEEAVKLCGVDLDEVQNSN